MRDWLTSPASGWDRDGDQEPPALPDDIVGMRHAVLRHRLVLTFEAVAERVSVENLIDAVFKAVPTP